mgnify:CR=1 FL=1
MYLPKSQIKQNKFTNGEEFVRLSDGQNYKGFYWQDSSGRYFSGKTPQDVPQFELIKEPTEEGEDAAPLSKNTSWTTKYNPKITSVKPGKVPSKYFAQPTDDNYDIGEFQRYFTKKANQNIYYEISKKDYQNLKNQNNTILWQLYQPITLPWQISGDKEEVYKTNRNIVMETEQQQRLPGFRKIFRDNYLQYYNQ